MPDTSNESSSFWSEQYFDAAEARNVVNFSASADFKRLPLSFDVDALRKAHEDVLKIVDYESLQVNAICLTQIPGDKSSYTGGNLRGRYWTRPDSHYVEVEREPYIDEEKYSQFVEAFTHTYFKHVYDELSKFCQIGRMRLLKTKPRTALSWHRDPEPRLHIPIFTNPGAIMLINHHCTHMPADGSVYFTDTRQYHSAVNGGEEERIHLVATLPELRLQSSVLE